MYDKSTLKAIGVKLPDTSRIISYSWAKENQKYYRIKTWFIASGWYWAEKLFSQVFTSYKKLKAKNMKLFTVVWVYKENIVKTYGFYFGMFPLKKIWTRRTICHFVEILKMKSKIKIFKFFKLKYFLVKVFINIFFSKISFNTWVVF